MSANEIAEKLCIEAESLGLCHPTEGMIANRLGSLLADHELEILHTLREGGFDKAAEYLECTRDLSHMEAQS